LAPNLASLPDNPALSIQTPFANQNLLGIVAAHNVISIHERAHFHFTVPV
jgi:hypothetical protein